MITVDKKKIDLNKVLSRDYMMSDTEFDYISSFIYDECGINLNATKKIMLTSRLQKRLRLLGMTEFMEYYEYIKSREGRYNEVTDMINVVTTNKTDFFRGPGHFEVLSETVLPELLLSKYGDNMEKIKIWSAGCSTGEEPYTVAMVMEEFFSNSKINGLFSILSSDICTESLSIAENGIYKNENLSPVPDKFIKKYFLRGKNEYTGFSRVTPELRSKIKFKRINLMDKVFEINTKMDIIFCRNVVIYFNRETQQELFNKFYNILRPGGYLFIGHSETLHSINEDFKFFRPSVYRKAG